MSEEEQKYSEPTWQKVIKKTSAVLTGANMPIDYARTLVQVYDDYTLIRPHLNGSSQQVINKGLGSIVESMKSLHTALVTANKVFGTETFTEINNSLEIRITEYESQYEAHESQS